MHQALKAIVEPKTIDPNATKQFIGLGNRYIELCKQAGYSDLHLSQTGIPEHFMQSSAKVKSRAIGYLQFNCEVIENTYASGQNPKDTSVFLWLAIKRLGLVPPSDMMQYITDNDIVELYFLNDFQIFRNFRFLELTSYTIDEMICRPWYRNIRRGILPNIQIIQKLIHVKMGRIKNIWDWGLEEHLANELDTRDKLQFKMKLKHLIPLFYQGRLEAVVSTNHCRVVT